MTYPGRVEAQFTVPSGQTVIATNGGSPKTIAVPAGSYYLSDFLDLLAFQLDTYSDSAAWALSLDTSANSTGRVTINCAGTFSLTLTAEIAAMIGVDSFAGVTASQLGARGPVGVWFPDTPLNLDGDPLIAPIASDLRATRGPTGEVFGLGGGNRSYEHSNVRWHCVPKNRVWTFYETTVNNSWETFVTTTQHGQGTAACAAWFRTLAPVQIYDMDGDPLGFSLAHGWSMIGVENIKPVLFNRIGLYDITIPTLVSKTSV